MVAVPDLTVTSTAESPPARGACSGSRISTDWPPCPTTAPPSFVNFADVPEAPPSTPSPSFPSLAVAPRNDASASPSLLTVSLAPLNSQLAQCPSSERGSPGSDGSRQPPTIHALFFSPLTQRRKTLEPSPQPSRGALPVLARSVYLELSAAPPKADATTQCG
jgi:hypothetical protein